ncbi:YdhK family protein [Peribacillus sp. FSL M8-0224]|uniref:YdhK family protein n=1 Tax=Peribacillus sp. FSL M8-0224 TaxID=2921568 RepID=UPI0030F84F1D
MLKKRMKMSISLSIFVALFLVLVACSNAKDENKENMEGMEGMDHGNMDHSSSEEVPEGLKEAKNPTYEVGSQAILETDHMEGMKGAKATIVGAYDTTVYAISYTPTTGGERVENHKWVIQEEIKDARDEPLEHGTEVTVDAAHMKGMDGAKAKIDSAEATTVYVVDYIPTTDGEEVKNHKWVTESELSPAK